MRLQLALLLLLAVLAALLAARVIRRSPLPAADLGRAALNRPTPEMSARLASLTDQVFLTLYLSDAGRMPSELRGLERELVTLCETLARASEGRVAWQIVDPTGRPELERYAAHRQVAPLNVRSVERDGYTERTVWCSMTVEYGSHPPARLDALRPEHVGRLQPLIVATLDQLEHPRRPVIALAAGDGFIGLAADLAARAELVRVDLDAGQSIPARADALVWMQPTRADAGRLRELELFLESGRSVLLAGSGRALLGWDAGDGAADGAGPVARLGSRPSVLRELLPAFGLQPLDGLLCDEFAEQATFAGVEHAAPFLLRCTAYHQDFQGLRGQPNGTLVFHLPEPLRLDGERLQQRGATAQVLASTSERAWVQPFAPGELTLAEARPEAGVPAGRVPLMVVVRPSLAWQGLFVASGSASPFADGVYEREDTAHRALLDVLMRELVSDGRLVQARIGRQEQAPLPELSAASRIGWRAACVLLLPALLVGAALLRGAFASGRRAAARAGRRGWAAAVSWRAAAALLVALGLAALLRPAGAQADLSQERLNVLAPETIVRAAAARGAQAVRAELAFSARDRLPPPLRAGWSRMHDLLAALSRHGAEIDVVPLEPDELDAAEVARLGLERVQVSARDEETTTVRSVHASLRLSTPASGRSTVLSFPDAAAFENLEFRLAFALWRLQTGRTVRIGFASDAPRLTAGEALKYFQEQGLMAPTGTDAYSLARQRLLASDFEVSWIDPVQPRLPDGLDALVWMQPRRPAAAMLAALVEHLRAGGRALVAAQQFQMIARQTAEAEFAIAYWPQPQTTDLETGWLAQIGVELVRKPFFDARATTAPLPTQVFRAGRREIQVMDAAQPFVVRASASRYAADSPVTRNLGDQALISPARIRLDEARLSSAGLRARPLISSSEQSWELDWSGGELSPGVLAGPPRGAGDAPLYVGTVPLAVEVEGRFPALDSAGGAAAPAGAAPGGPSGRLVLVGCSVAFQDERLLAPDYRGDHLLLNAVTALALEPGLAEVAAKRPVARGFEPPDAAQRLRWRAIVLFAHPAVALLLGVALAVRQRSTRGEV